MQWIIQKYLHNAKKISLFDLKYATLTMKEINEILALYSSIETFHSTFRGLYP